jgi:hypothetical protein
LRRPLTATLVLLLAAPCWAADVVTISGADKPIPAPQFAVLTVAVAPGDQVEWEITPEPAQVVKAGEGEVHVAGLPGEYKVRVDIINFDQKRWGRGRAVLTFGPAKPPDLPPPAQPDSLYFLVVRPDGQPSAAFTKSMSDPNWLALRARGYKFGDKTVTDAKSLFVEVPAGTALPVVVTLKVTGGKSLIVRGPVPLPSGADILKLPEGVQ